MSTAGLTIDDPERVVKNQYEAILATEDTYAKEAEEEKARHDARMAEINQKIQRSKEAAAFWKGNLERIRELKDSIREAERTIQELINKGLNEFPGSEVRCAPTLLRCTLLKTKMRQIDIQDLGTSSTEVAPNPATELNSSQATSSNTNNNNTIGTQPSSSQRSPSLFSHQAITTTGITSAICDDPSSFSAIVSAFPVPTLTPSTSLFKRKLPSSRSSSPPPSPPTSDSAEFDSDTEPGSGPWGDAQEPDNHTIVPHSSQDPPPLRPGGRGRGISPDSWRRQVFEQEEVVRGAASWYTETPPASKNDSSGASSCPIFRISTLILFGPLEGSLITPSTSVMDDLPSVFQMFFGDM